MSLDSPEFSRFIVNVITRAEEKGQIGEAMW